MDFNNPSETIRVVSLNFLNNPKCFDKRLKTLSGFLKSMEPDVVLFQEILSEKQKELADSLEDLGYHYKIFGKAEENKLSGNAIFSKISFVDTDIIGFENISTLIEKPSTYIDSVVVHLNYKNVDISLINGHFTWGFQNEASRLFQAEIISKYAEQLKAENEDRVIIFGGDLNASEHSATVQFLKGRGLTPSLYSTYWVDAWEVHGTPNNWSTTDPKLYWNKQTALGVGSLNPNFTPARRIDYLFSYGWCYGKLGYPLRFGRFGDSFNYSESDLSDHYAIFADYVVKY